MTHDSLHWVHSRAKKVDSYFSGPYEFILTDFMLMSHSHDISKFKVSSVQWYVNVVVLTIMSASFAY